MNIVGYRSSVGKEIMAGWHWKARWIAFVFIVCCSIIGKTHSSDEIRNTSIAENTNNKYHLVNHVERQVNGEDYLLEDTAEDDPDHVPSNISSPDSLSFASSSTISSVLSPSSPLSSILFSSASPLKSSSLFSDSTVLIASPSVVPSTTLLSTSQSILPSSVSLVNNLTTSVIADNASPLSSISTNIFNCLLNLGISPEELDKFFQKVSQNCLETLLCNEIESFSVETYQGGSIYWFKNMNSSCYNELYGVDDNGVSKFGNISPTITFMALHPACVQSEDMAHLEILDKDLQVLPVQCRKLLCYAGVNSFNYGSLPAMMFYPQVTDKFDYIDDCQKALDDMMKYNNISSSEGQVNIFHTSKYPETSPCSTYIVFAITNSGSHMIIPFRSTWCRPLKRRMWHDLMVSSYMEFLEGSDLELYHCLARKNHYRRENKKEIVFFQDLVGRNIELPKIPDPCISFLCNPNVNFLNVQHSKSKRTLLWFSSLKSVIDNIQKANSQLLTCQESIPRGKEESVYGIKSISLPGSFAGESVPLIPTLQWSCPAYHEEEEINILRSETLASLWLKDKNIPEACKLLVCNATITRLGKDLVSVFIVHSHEYSDSCQTYSEHVTIFDVGEYIFSFDIIQTNSTVVFMVAETFRNSLTVNFLSHLHVNGDDKDARCCSGNYKNLDQNIYNFNGNSYYSCSISSKTSLELHCLGENSLWNTKHVMNNTFLIAVREDLIYSEFIHWLATLDISMSESSHRFIQSLDIQVEHFLNNIIFVSNVESRSDEGFLEFLSEIRAKHVQCDGSQFYTLCYRDNGKFEVTKYQEGYLIFLHQCSIRHSEKDKTILLLLSHFLKTGPNQEYLCRENNMVLMVPELPKHLSFSAKGPPEEVALLMNNLQAEMKSWSWNELEDISGKQDSESKLCLELSNIKEFSKLLELGNCIILTQNRSTVYLLPKQKMFYYFQTFPLIDSKSESSLWDLIVASSPVTSSLVNYNADLSGHKIYISRQNENPAHQFLHHKHITDSSSHRISVHHITKLSMVATLRNNSQCLRDLLNNDFLLYAATRTLWIGPVLESSSKKSCFSSLSDDTINFLERGAAENKSTINKFWPTCSYNMIVARPHETSAVSDWDYLPSECKMREIVLLIATVTVTVIMSLGNACALVVIIKSILHKESTFLIYASIALADLLLGIFPGALAVYDTFSLMSGVTTLQDYNPNFWSESLDHLKLHRAPDFSQLKFERSGFPMVCSLIINVSIGVSLLSLVLLGTEQLKALMGKPFHRCHVVTGIIVTWVIGIIYGVLMNCTIDGWSFIGHFDPVTKLTFSVDGTTIPKAIFYLVVTSIALASFAIFVLMITSSFLVHYQTQYPSKFITASTSEEAKNQKQATRIFQLIVTFSVAACIPLLIDKIINLRSSSPLCHFLIYWISLALLSWKWSLYTLTQKSFRRHIYIILWRSQNQPTHIKSQLSQMENDDLETAQLKMELRSLSSNESLTDSGSDSS